MAEKAETVEVLVPELTLHKPVMPLVKNGEVIGHQNGLGKTWFKGERVLVSDLSPDYIEALDDETHPSHAAVAKRIKRSTSDPKEDEELRLGLPFAGYGDMDEDQIVAILPNLPSATQQRIKTWESKQANPRERITTFNTGFGESPIGRQNGEVNSGTAEDDTDPDKPVRALKTRSVPDDGPVESGEGITGTGEPAVAPGTAAAEDSDEGDAPVGPPRRRSRRTRPKVAAKADDTGDDSGDSDNE